MAKHPTPNFFGLRAIKNFPKNLAAKEKKYFYANAAGEWIKKLRIYPFTTTVLKFVVVCNDKMSQV